MRRRWTPLLLILGLGATACGSSAEVAVRAGDATPVTMGPNEPAETTTVPDTPPTDSSAPDTDPSVTTTEADTTPKDTAPQDTAPRDTTSQDTTSEATVPTTDTGPVFKLDTDKPVEAYDKFLEKAINDIQHFWRATYPVVYGQPYQELRGGIFPVYPGRTDVPGGCGMRRTTYADVEGNAFYCGEGDFIAYDDAELLPSIDKEVGRFALAVVIAHEWGHAIQSRANFAGATLLLEQQADCFAGAWVRYVADGKGTKVKFNDNDLNVAMNGLIAVRDQPGAVGRSPNAHGSAFDRVGAFQEGWFGGAKRCRDFDTNAPPTTLLPFSPGEEVTGGNAPYSEIVGLLQKGLDSIWSTELTSEGKTFTHPTIDVGADDTASRCDNPPDNALKVAFYCPASNTVVASDRRLTQLYNSFGDNAVGIIIASAYSEAVQRTLGSTLTGEPRALANDCLTGAWTQKLFPETGATKDVTISAGDLDEGIQTLIAIGDPTADTNLQGSPFEKIGAFRSGVLSGLSACIAKISG